MDIQDIAGEKLNINVSITGTGDFTLVTGVAGKTIYAYELIGGASATVDFLLKVNAATIATFNLVANQGITMTSIANLAGVPRWVCPNGSNLVVNLSAAATFKGNLNYAFRE